MTETPPNATQPAPGAPEGGFFIAKCRSFSAAIIVIHPRFCKDA